MATHTLAVGREIVAEPEQVWSVVADVDRWARILTVVDKVERLEGTGLAVGASWRESRRLLGANHTQDVTVTAVEDGRSFTLTSISDDATLTVVYRVKPDSLGTRLELDATLEEVRGGLRRLGGGGGVKVVREALERDLADFVAALRS